MTEPQTPQGLEFDAAQIAVYLQSNPSGSTLKAICSDQLGRQRTKLSQQEALERFMEENAEAAGWVNTHQGWRFGEIEPVKEAKHPPNQASLPDMGPDPSRKVENQRCEDTGQEYRAACLAAHPWLEKKRQTKEAFDLACREEGYADTGYSFTDPAGNLCEYWFDRMRHKITPPGQD